MWSKNTSKKYVIIACSIGIYLGAVIWITLLSREPSYSLRVITPFWSYQKIIAGDPILLIENIENILMFIPMGYFLQMILKKDWKQNAIRALLISFVIEIIQLVTTAGCFEFDDLLHNTIGAILGYLLFKFIPLTICIKDKQIGMTILLTVVIAILLFWGVDQYRGYINYRRMVLYASQNDRDGRRNLFVPSGESGYCWDTDVYVKYLEEGSISITGEADKRSWFELGRIVLQPGDYIFEGLSDIEEETVALELEYFDKQKHSYVRLVPDIGTIEKAVFRLEEKTKVRGLVGVYPGCDCDIIARPVIFRLGE